MAGLKGDFVMASDETRSATPSEAPRSTHTETPWEAAPYDDAAEAVTVAIVGDWVVRHPTPGIKGGNYRDTYFGAEAADARLLSAAPDLLTALESILAAELIYTGAIYETMEASNMDGIADLAERARAAIRKAKGEA